MLVSSTRPKHRNDVGEQAAGELCSAVDESDGLAMIQD